MGSKKQLPSHPDVTRPRTVTSSLKPPQRDSAISIDDADPTERLQANASAAPIPSSESDEDENEATSRQTTASKRFRKRATLRPSPSSLSLESSASEADMAPPAPVRQAPPQKRRRVETASAPAPTRPTPVQSAPTQVTNSVPTPRVAPAPQQPRQPNVYQHSPNVPGAQPATVMANAAPATQVPPQGATAPQHAAPVMPTVHAPAPANGNQPTEVVAQDAALADYEVINITTLPENDVTGWDRFIFFTHRPQRFQFNDNNYLSTLSPFSAVTSDMKGVAIGSVCAVCGAGGLLRTCGRCNIGFHVHCTDQRPNLLQRQPWLCTACLSVMGTEQSTSWNPTQLPYPLPPPQSGLPRLIADAAEGNPIDYVFNPSLFNFYIHESGGDWLRCRKCRRIRIIGVGVLAESVHIPFDCSLAFWLPENQRVCASGPNNPPKDAREAHIERYTRQQSRRRCALFSLFFGEEDRTDFGYPPLPELSAEPATAKSKPVAEVIVIDSDQPSVVKPNSSKPLGALPTQNPTVGLAGSQNRDTTHGVQGRGVQLNMNQNQGSNANGGEAVIRNGSLDFRFSALNTASKQQAAQAVHQTTPLANPANPSPQATSQRITPQRSATVPAVQRSTGNHLQARSVPGANSQRRTPVSSQLQSGSKVQQVVSTVSNPSAAAPQASRRTSTARPTGRAPAQGIRQPAQLPATVAKTGVHAVNAVAQGSQNRANVTPAIPPAVKNAAVRRTAPSLPHGVPRQQVQPQTLIVQAGVGHATSRPAGAPTNTIAQGHGLGQVPVTGQKSVAQAQSSGNVATSAVGGGSAATSAQVVPSDVVLQMVASLGFDEDVEDQLTDMALADNSALAQLYTAFGNRPEKFKRHASRLAQRSISNGGVASSSTDGAPGAVNGTATVANKKLLNTIEQRPNNTVKRKEFDHLLISVRERQFKESIALNNALANQMKGADAATAAALYDAQMEQLRMKWDQHDQEIKGITQTYVKDKETRK